MIHLPKMKLVFVSVLAIAFLPCYAIAQSAAPKAIAGEARNSGRGWIKPSSQVISNQPPPPDTGTPDGQRTPGGTRPEMALTCKQTEQPLTALVPENSKALTTAEYPIFWFYIPYSSQDIHSIEFSLHNRDETTTLYRTTLQLTTTPGVFGIPLPPIPEHSLKLNESYHWYFTVNCEPKKTVENDIVLDGWVTRVQQSPNLWHDELTNLAKRYLSNPQNTEVKKAWTELLKSVGLEELAQAPLVSAVIDLEKELSGDRQ